MTEGDQNESKPAKPRKKFGCAAGVFAGGIAALVGGALLLNKWDTGNGATRAGGIVLVVLGTLAMLPFAVAIAIRIVVQMVVGKVTKQISESMTELKKAGGEMVALNKNLYGDLHEYRPATDDDFAQLNRDLYTDAQNRLTSLGFRHLGDVVNKTIEASGLLTVIRVMASTDGSVGAGLYHFKPQRLPRGMKFGEMLVPDLGTEFTDNTYVTTSNTQEIDQTTVATGFHKTRLPLATPIEQLVSTHETEKQMLLAAKANVSVVTIHTLADALASEQRQQAAKVAFRKAIGYVDPEKVRRVAKNAGHDDDAANLSANLADDARRDEMGA